MLQGAAVPPQWPPRQWPNLPQRGGASQARDGEQAGAGAARHSQAVTDTSPTCLPGGIRL